jgi:hypothetical protein
MGASRRSAIEVAGQEEGATGCGACTEGQFGGFWGDRLHCRSNADARTLTRKWGV